MKKTNEEKIAALKAANAGTDAEAIKKATEELSTEIQKMGPYMQKQQDPQPTTDNTQPKNEDGGKEDGESEKREGGSGTEGNVRDAETK